MLVFVASPDQASNLGRKQMLEAMGHSVRMYDQRLPVVEQVGDADALMPSVTKISADVIAAAPRLKLIVQMGVGLDMVDIPFATERRIAVVNMPGLNAIGVAETAFLLMLGLAKKYRLAQVSLKERKFSNPRGTELAGKTLSILGLGASGSDLAVRARAFGMRVIAIKKHPRGFENAAVEFIGGFEDLPAVLGQADVVSVHLPHSPETDGLINAERLALMKPTSFLINVARAPIIVRDDLLATLRNDRIGGVGLDVFWDEPVDPEDEILSFPQVIATPHIAGSTLEARERGIVKLREVLAAVEAGRRPEGCVNL